MEDSDRSKSPTPERPPEGASYGVQGFATYQVPGKSGFAGVDWLAGEHPELFQTFNVPVNCRIAFGMDPRHPGRMIWTFVPSAYGPQGVAEDPRTWPQHVIALGKERRMDQDTWDRFKCDPNYFCYVPTRGMPYVKLRTEIVHDTTPEPMVAEDRSRRSTPYPKRTGSDTVDTESSPRKKQRTTVETESDTEIEEVQPNQYEALQARLRREKKRRERLQRDAKGSSFRMASMANDLPHVFTPENGRSPSPVRHPNGKGQFMETDPTQTKRPHQTGETEHTTSSSKRQKRSPMSTTGDEKIRAAEKRQREYTRRQNAQRRHSRLGRKAEAHEKDFWRDVNFSSFKGRSFSLDPEDIASQTPHPPPDEREVKSETEPPLASAENPIWVDSGSDEDEENEVHASLHTDESEYDHKAREGFAAYDVVDSEEERMARLAESRKKMEEINAQDAERIAARRRMEEAQRRKEEEERRRRQEEARRRRQQEEDAERRRRAREEAQRNARRSSWTDQDQYRRSDPYTGWYHRTSAFWGDDIPPRPGGINFEWFEQHPRFNNSQRRAGPSSTSATNGWTSAKALQRYNTLSEAFDKFKGTPDQPVPPLDQIPWPVLLPPGFTLNDVDWTAVEKFFKEAETLMGGRGRGRNEWKEFLKTSTRRFHPDRWRARGLISDKGFGSDVEEKVNHVAKVLTPLYRSLDQ